MELKPGYKQTEVGVIPEDWDLATVSDACDLVVDCKNRTPPFVSHCEYAVVRTSNVRNGRFIDVDLRFTDYESFRRWTSRAIPKAGDIMLTREAPLGEVCAVPETPSVCLGQRMMLLRPSGHVAQSSYLLFSLTSEVVKNNLLKKIGGSTVGHAKLADVRLLPVPLPKLEEQKHISSILLDVDNLVRDLQSLIGKKQGIKQAAMQELLTGKRRLPGFEGEWVVKRLGDEIRDLEAGVSVRSTTDKEQPSTGRYILKTSAVSQGRFSPIETKEIISCDISRAKTPIKAGDLIISRMNTPALVGECGYSHSDHPNLFLPDRLWRAAYRDPQAVSSRWLSYTLSTQQNRTRIKELATGTSGSMKNISKRALLDLEIKWPSLDEQNAIAELLSEMDDDIDAINAQLHKAQGIKQGMMQQLLTGKIRLR